MSITVNNVTKKYNEQKALNKVNFSINTGEIVGFLGPNGAGKSTMMKIISGYIPASEGSVEVAGLDIQSNSITCRGKIGYLPENNPLYLELYVKEFLNFIAGLHKISNPKERIQEMISLVGLEQEQNKKIKQLSKGYRQRVGLAQALIHDPEVLILDEPTTGLDPNQIIEIRNLILSVGKNKTVMLSTHIMQEVEAICDRAIIINKGEIVADKSIEDLIDLNVSGFKLVIEFEKPVELNELENIEGVESVVLTSDKKVEINSKIDNRAAISRWSVEKNNMIVNMLKADASLEQTFHKLTR